MKAIMISIGNFLFKYRNFLFPLYILALFLLFRPPATHGYPQPLQDLAAVAVALSGLAVRGIVIGLAYIKRGGLNKKVYAANLVTEGMFSVCRNPLYVGNMLIYAGQFLMFGNYPCFAIGVLSFWFIYECIIAAEEYYLRDKFGPAYDEYCRDVPRWMPKLSKISEATAGMKFDWKKVLYKDYSTMSSTLTILAFIQLWKVLAHRGFSQSHTEVYSLIGAIVLISLIAFAVRTIKKSAPPITPEQPAEVK
ncbi:MAG: isoprenylcysteine carboxylmethyltransferase family protein [Luteolibacter sp.]|uniref:methyltransferase family protein n=1 Tax=Luteolibacter sp. TaxID=1962973 RepID=UPI0032653057